MIAAAWRARIGAGAAAFATAVAIALFARVRWPWVWLCWVALVPWLAALDRTASLRGALAVGVLMCEAFALVVFGWFPRAIQNYTAMPWPLALLVVVVVAPLLEPQFLSFALARYLARQRPAAWAVAPAAAGIYVGTEWAFPKLFADTLGQALYASALMRQAADLAGAQGLTFLLIIANECVLSAVRAVTSDTSPRARMRRAIAPVVCFAAVVLGLLVYGSLRVRQFDHAEARGGERISAGVVQANISKYGRLAAEMGTFDATRMILDTYVSLSTEVLQRGPVDLLVWPETVYPTTFGAPKSEEGAAFDREIAEFVGRAGAPLLFGAYEREGADEFNAAMLLQPTADGKLSLDSYRKRWLFPLIVR
ncbi:MAG TPA: apolipoprotein N-acyltransferase, partial [Candidatus Kryptonia bacterium]|nr:apolipoprotein N-acyltransferase [Candidatus Kryptonia bacterium]